MSDLAVYRVRFRDERVGNRFVSVFVGVDDEGIVQKVPSLGAFLMGKSAFAITKELPECTVKKCEMLRDEKVES